jgi:hypothetical protein
VEQSKYKVASEEVENQESGLPQKFIKVSHVHDSLDRTVLAYLPNSSLETKQIYNQVNHLDS